eukprot:scaffold34407_cov34-Attheya_sp.AAC.2
MDGLDVQMANVTKQDRALSVPIMHCFMNMYEKEWKEKKRERTWNLSPSGPRSFILCGLARIVGKFNAEGGGTGQHVIPIAATTTSSGLPNLCWA